MSKGEREKDIKRAKGYIVEEKKERNEMKKDIRKKGMTERNMLK